MTETLLPQEPPNLVGPKDPVLRQPLSKFDFANPPCNPVELYELLSKRMLDLGGIGLSANQLGLPYNCFVIRSDPVRPFFNARIVDSSEEIVELDEGCLTFPGLTLKVKRPRMIRVRYADPVGETQTQKFQDVTARVIQHEMDHMIGQTFGSRVSRLQLELALKKAKKHGFNYSIGDLI